MGVCVRERERGIEKEAEWRLSSMSGRGQTGKAVTVFYVVTWARSPEGVPMCMAWVVFKALRLLCHSASGARTF